MDAVPGNDRERVAQKISLILGGQDALDLHMKRRPYDVGPPPVPPQPYKGVASSTAGSGSTPSQLLGSHSSMSSTRGGGIAASSSSTTLDSFVVSNNEDRLHQHAEAVLLRASQDRGKVSGQYYKPTASVAEARPTSSSAAGYQFSVPPPPVLPPDFGASDRFSTQQQPPTGVPSGVTVNAETLDWKSPKKHQPRRTVGVSPSLSMTNGSQRPSSVATDLSVDGEDAGALLNWAASLNQNGGGW